MDNTQINPLQKHFRQPAISMHLPSQGKYWPEGTLDLNMTGQIAVYPMTTRDEITIRTPDVLLNGEGIVSIIQSCCPQIKNAWKMPSIDVDAVLIAIRIASYGQMMDIDTVCTNEECKHENKNSLNLTDLLDSIKAPNYSSPLIIDNLKIKLRPQSYFEGNRINQSNFEEQRILQIINNDTMEEDIKIAQFKNHLNRLIDINMDIIVDSTEYIELEDGTKVDNKKFIKEYYENADNRIIKEVRLKFDEYAKIAELPKSKIKCEECGTEYSVDVKFDYTYFFDNAS
jgi:hypothetical protein